MTSMTAEPFAALLRRLRLTAGLTQEALAERAGLSARGIQDLERGGRRLPRAETVRMLADALALSAEQRSELIAAANPGWAKAVAAPAQRFSPARPPTPPTPLIGREREVANACALLRQSGVRLLTLSGPGGIGKTRLAQAVAAEMAPDFADRVAWVELAPLREATLVGNALARALGVDEHGGDPLSELLALAVAERRLLLVIDNCEHVLPAMPLIGRLLAAGPHLSVLATSRARLRLRGERELPVEPLAVPALTRSVPPLAGLAGVAAVRLFVERATAVRPEFALTAENAATVAAICERLEGLPLALELAAARIKLLPPEALLNRLSHRLPLLRGGARDAPERQQTMRDAIAWSHELLSAEERRLFRRLAVFVGGFTLESATAVAADGAEAGGQDAILDGVIALAEQSLLGADRLPTGTDDARFSMLETVREYALEQLHSRGEETVIRRAQADFCLALAERADAELTGPAQATWLERLEAEHDNLRAALVWLVESGDVATAVRIAAALGRFWRVHGHPREGLSWLERILALAGDAPNEARARALEETGRLAHELSEPSQAETRYEAALAIWRELGNLGGQAHVLDDLGNVAHDRGDFARAMHLHEQALALARVAGDRRAAGRALNNLGMAALYQGEAERAHEAYAEALTLLRELGDAFGVNVVLNNLGLVAIRRGDLARAAALYDECRTGCEQLGDQWGVAGALVNLGEIRLQQGEFALAGRLYEEARQRFEGLGDGRAEAAACHGLAAVALSEGRAAQAASLFLSGLSLAYGVDAKMSVAEGLEGLAEAALRLGQGEPAAHFLGAAASLREGINSPVAEHRREALACLVDTSRETLGADAFGAAWETGRGWTLDEAVAAATALAGTLGDMPS